MAPILLLDFDDVICLNRPYGGYDILVPESDRPPDLWDRLWHPPAIAVLREVLCAHTPKVVLTTSWRNFMDRPVFVDAFSRSGVPELATLLHEAWEAPQRREETRLAAIERWLADWHHGEPFVVIDDHLSGTGLLGSWIDQSGRLVMCEVGQGLGQEHISALSQALARPLTARPA